MIRAGGGSPGRPPGTAGALSAEELVRYSRHLLLPELGEEGQKKLKASRVLLIGAGGLGSPAALYLAAAGVGTLGIVDADRVDMTNLHRQVLHRTADIGRPKVESARDTLSGINPHVQVECHAVRLEAANVMEICSRYDLVVDGSDNFPTRYLVNDACVLLGLPNVHGSIFRFEGQVTVFAPGEGPCYRCLYPSPPPPELVPNCAEAGVLGVLPGIVGSLQALEAIKWITGRGTSLAGRLLLFDALAPSFREMKVRRDPSCPACGDSPTILSPKDEGEWCAPAGPVGDEVSVEALQSILRSGNNVLLLDVREPHEYEIANLGGKLIPLGQLEGRLGELDSAREIVVYCKTGSRSAAAAELLRRRGFPRARNLTGGIAAWRERIDPSLRKY